MVKDFIPATGRIFCLISQKSSGSPDWLKTTDLCNLTFASTSQYRSFNAQNWSYRWAMNDNEYLPVQLSTWEKDGQGTQRKMRSVPERFPSFCFPFSSFRNTCSFPVPLLRNKKNEKCLRSVPFSSLAPGKIKINYRMAEFVYRNLKCASFPLLFAWVGPVNGWIGVKLKNMPPYFCYHFIVRPF